MLLVTICHLLRRKLYLFCMIFSLVNRARLIALQDLNDQTNSPLLFIIPIRHVDLEERTKEV